MTDLQAGPILGASNFRDCGGLGTRDGRIVGSGRLFRSNQFSRLDEKDIATITALSIGTVVDLRSEVERNAQPSVRQLGRKPDYVSHRADTDFIFNDIFARTEPTEEAWVEAFSTFYAQLPELYAHEYRLVMELLAKGDLPLIIHCSAGKDRTGVVIAIILDLVGVNSNEIVRDYMESGLRLGDDQHFRNMFSDAKLDRYASLPPSCRNVMLGTRPEFLGAALSGLEQAYGSTAGYVRDRLGVPQGRIEQICDNLLLD